MMGRLFLLAAAALAAAALPEPPVAGPALGARARLIDVDGLRVAPAPSARTAADADTEVATCANGGLTAADDYALAGWKASGTATVYLSRSTIPSNLIGVRRATQRAFDTWRAAESGVPAMTVVSRGAATAASANRRNELMWGAVPRGMVAATYTWRWSDGRIESDVVFNQRLPWFLAASRGDGCKEGQPAYDVRNVATHEFGHVFGMTHPIEGRYESMYAVGYTGETLKRSLGRGDSAGIRALY